MIVHQDKTIFIHIPKCAGQSVESYFLTRHGYSWDDRASFLLRQNTDKNRGPSSLSHLKASEYSSLEYIDKKKFKDYFKFSFVRNPYARLVSTYKYRGYESYFSFKDYVFKHMPEEGSAKEAMHIIPQYKFIYDEFSNKRLVDYVGRFENIKEDFTSVIDILGFEDASLPHVNISPRKKEQTIKDKLRSLWIHKGKNYISYRDYYDTKTKQRVSKLFEQDIDTFKYVF